MPKEFVPSTFEGMPTHIDDRQGGVTVGDPLPSFRVEVCWGTNEYVQIATANPEAPLGTIESGLYVDLNRQGINHLIRLLRKARDKAYGRDE